MYISKEKFEEIKKQYSGLLIVDSDTEDALAFVQTLLEAEADALKECEPTATNTISRLEAAAYEVYDFSTRLDEFSEC